MAAAVALGRTIHVSHLSMSFARLIVRWCVFARCSTGVARTLSPVRRAPHAVGDALPPLDALAVIALAGHCRARLAVLLLVAHLLTFWMLVGYLNWSVVVRLTNMVMTFRMNLDF